MNSFETVSLDQLGDIGIVTGARVSATAKLDAGSRGPSGVLEGVARYMVVARL